MCATCGCGEDEVRVTALHDHGHEHRHTHEHPHDHPQHDSTPRTVMLETDVLAKNDRLAQRTRAWLAERRALTVNMMSSPGSGKTTLLERTIRDLMPSTTGLRSSKAIRRRCIDAQRIQATGARVVQINTGAGCHLDAAMLERGLRELDPPAGLAGASSRTSATWSVRRCSTWASRSGLSSSRLRRATTSR